MKYLGKYNLRKGICVTLVLSLLMCMMFNSSSLATIDDLHNAIATSAASEEVVPTIEAEAENIFTVDDLTLQNGVSTEGGNALQGGIKVGNYLYAAYVNTNNDELKNKIGWIVKYDPATGKELARSEQLNLGHANDITYNSKLDRLVLAHCSPVGNQVSIINYETLTIEQTYYISKSIYCIDYNATEDKYVVGLLGDQYAEQSFQILNSNLTPIGNESVETPYAPPEDAAFKNYITQGCTSDDAYIYFGISDYTKEYDEENKLTKDATGNYIAVYNWSGEFQTVIHIPFDTYTEDGKRIEYEIEYLYIEDGVIYFGTNNKTDGMGEKADLYRVIM